MKTQYNITLSTIISNKILVTDMTTPLSNDWKWQLLTATSVYAY